VGVNHEQDTLLRGATTMMSIGYSTQNSPAADGRSEPA